MKIHKWIVIIVWVLSAMGLTYKSGCHLPPDEREEHNKEEEKPLERDTTAVDWDSFFMHSDIILDSR